MSQFPPDNKTLHQYFIGLLIADISLSVLEFLVALIGVMMADVAIEDAGGSTELTSSDAAVAGLSCFFLVFVLPVVIASWVGLFQYKAWGRWLYLATVVTLHMLLVPLSIFDFSLTWGLESSLSNVGWLVTGAILAMVYMTPLANRFTKPIAASYVHS